MFLCRAKAADYEVPILLNRVYWVKGLKKLGIFFQIYFEVKYKCVYLHSLSETVLSQSEKDSSLKR